MPVRAWAQRARRPLGALLVVASLGSVVLSVIYTRRSRTQADDVCHPNLSHLRHGDGREVLLIGTVPLDLDGASRKLVRSSLDVLQPDVVMVEGTWTAGLNAMLFSGTWELHGITPPRDLNWTDIGDADPVEIVKPKANRGWFGLGGGAGSPMPMPRLPERSLVPLKVRNWAHHMRGSVGSDVAAAVAAAAAAGVPVRFLGPADGGLQGHFLVSMLANQAALELLQEEHQRGSQMPNSDVDAALRRAEGHVREDAKKWLRDVRGETARSTERVEEHLRTRVPAKIREAVTEQAQARIEGTSSRVAEAMEAFRRGAVVLAVDQLVGVEERLKQAGYSFISDCA
mmetsp:Transcript_85576/g.215670  ORF Transcript_85576/g.215670 Transcript_85576/m.215670 type:complete len:342 (+) Transcript_85576:95-1120(+)|eukprot:CAMPEP_0115593174 /NCGR_PEP_ID=MMETSP0272-20121206/11160_1 /TAXON_ID=71861 /ORGANISM="Scrippsiella trochoidea, Strain CCMP3099" /LENGTH=341 /DNA_ID=CAMNT_0003028425 /DNA_START=81 /DNA_END=1106 /DNA_ORIENTATION=-